MARNIYFNNNLTSEQNLFEDIVIESLKIYGQELYYLPRDLVAEDRILGDDPGSSFNSSYKIEMYIDNIEGFEGEGDLFTRFGVEIRDEATFVVARRRWEQTVGRYDNDITGERPREGDLIYIPLSKSLFEIRHVEHEQPFYQLGNLATYKCKATLFEYTGEDLDTGVAEIDDIEVENAYTYMLTLNDSGQSGTFTVGENVTQTLASGVVMTGEVSRWSDSDNKLGLIHVNASDNKYGNFVTGIALTGASSSATGTPTLVAEEGLIKASSTEKEQNTYFDSLVDFLDFSESNPFGDPQ